MLNSLSDFFGNIRHKKIVIGIVAIGVLVLIGLPLFVTIYNMNQGVEDVAGNTVGEQPDETERVTLVQITNSPTSYYDQYVQLSGYVEELHSDRLFSLSSDDTDNQLLISMKNDTAHESNHSLSELRENGRIVEIKGLVREYGIDDIEREYGVDISMQSSRVLESRPMLMADIIAAPGDDNLIY